MEITYQSRMPPNTVFTGIQVYDVGWEACHPGYTFGPHIRPYHLIHYCKRGSGTFQNASGVCSVHAGQIFLIFPGETTVYAADTAEPWEYVWIAFTGDGLEQLRTLAPVCDYPADTFLRLQRTVQEAVLAPEAYIACVYEILYRLVGSATGQSPVYEQARRYLELHYGACATLTRLAASLGFDRRYLARMFKAHYGISMKAYLTCVRMEHAKRLLAEGQSVTKTASLTGYADAFSFSKIFCAKVGIPPSDFAKAKRKTEIL